MDLIRDKRVKDAIMNATVQNMFARGELRKDHPLQRKPGRWTDSDKSGLIATVLKDEDMDSIKVCEQLTDHGVILWVIDGLQRLTTLNAYQNNSFKLGKSLEFPIVAYQSAKKDAAGSILKDEYGNYEYELVAYDLRGKFYKELPVELQERFSNYKIDIVKHLDCTDEEIGYHIRRYNKQKSMNAAENTVTYMDHIAKEVKRISLHHKFFKHDSYKETERNNGTIERIVAESVMCMFHLDKWQKQSRMLGGFLNEHSSRQEFERLNRNLNRLHQVYCADFQTVFTAKNSFLWFTLFDHFTEWGFADEKFVDFVRAFHQGLCEREVNGETFRHLDQSKATKDKAVIVKKLAVLETLLKEFLQISSEEQTACVRETEALIAEVVQIAPEKVRQELEFYGQTLDDLTERTIRDGSKLLDAANRSSLLAMVSYSYEQDVDLDQWLVQYAEKNHTYFPDQRKNYLHMKADFKRFLQRKELVSQQLHPVITPACRMQRVRPKGA